MTNQPEQNEEKCDYTEIRQTALQGGYTDALTAPMSLMVTQREFWEALGRKMGRKMGWKKVFYLVFQETLGDEKYIGQEVEYRSKREYTHFWETNYDSGMEKAMEYLNGLVK